MYFYSIVFLQRSLEQRVWSLDKFCNTNPREIQIWIRKQFRRGKPYTMAYDWRGFRPLEDVIQNWVTREDAAKIYTKVCNVVR